MPLVFMMNALSAQMQGGAVQEAVMMWKMRTNPALPPRQGFASAAAAAVCAVPPELEIGSAVKK